MTLKQQHSPTPWLRNGDSIQSRAGGDWIVARGEYLPEVHKHGRSEGDWAANAEFIVRACNSHDALVAAATAALPDLEHYVSTHGPGPDRRFEELREVLRAAEGGAAEPRRATLATMRTALEAAAPILDSFLNGGGEYVEPDAIDAALMQVREALRLAREG